MNKNVVVVGLLFFLASMTACNKSASEADSKAAAAATAEAERSEARAAKKAMFIRASAAKSEERELALFEKAKLAASYKDANGKLIYNKAEVNPTYEGGDTEMRRYLKDNLKYPEGAYDKGIEGTVFVDFIVDQDGRVRDVAATDVVGDDVDQSFKDEAVRVVASMPGWRAGLQHETPVSASFSIPITFEIN
jgi:TonB family protein